MTSTKIDLEELYHLDWPTNFNDFSIITSATVVHNKQIALLDKSTSMHLLSLEDFITLATHLGFVVHIDLELMAPIYARKKGTQTLLYNDEKVNLNSGFICTPNPDNVLILTLLHTVVEKAERVFYYLQEVTDVFGIPTLNDTLSCLTAKSFKELLTSNLNQLDECFPKRVKRNLLEAIFTNNGENIRTLQANLKQSLGDDIKTGVFE